MPTDALKKRSCPPLRPREEMLEILLREEYGYFPPKPDKILWEACDVKVKNCCGGKASYQKILARCFWGEREFAFPFSVCIPTKKGPHPFFVLANFRDAVPDWYLPVEELIDNGFATLSFYYRDVCDDNDDFTDGLAGVFYPDGKRQPHDGGKIVLWSWAAQRVMDYAQTLDGVLDLRQGVICGHSRLGKTALLTAACDLRFSFAYSNDSGCCGAALSRGKEGESLRAICTRFPYWFCENFLAYPDREDALPFDQHYLLASIAPRRVLVGSASLDHWADPVSEQLSCLAASPAFPKGLEQIDRFAEVGESFLSGDIGYHLRCGKHAFCREDWHQLIRFVRSHTDEASTPKVNKIN